MHRMYVFQHLRELGEVKEKKEVSSTSTTKVSTFSVKSKEALNRRWTTFTRRRNAGGSDRSLGSDHVASRIDVLFYTFADRETCLGVGEKIFDRIHDRGMDITGAFYQNDRDKIIGTQQHRGCSVITLRARLSAKGFFRFIQLIPVVFLFGLKSKAVSSFVFRHPLMTLINLLKITTTSASMSKMLDRVKPRLILSCNEQGGGDASILFSLARKRGIKTIQYMHAVPTKQFVPFICDEYWSWSELTTRMLLDSEQDSRVRAIGSLEHDESEVCSNSSGEAQVGRRILFLAQMGMDEVWGIHSVADGMHEFCEGLRLYSGIYKVRVREHPSAGIEERDMLHRSMENIPFELTTKATPLAEDIAWATHVYTVCSNAIFAALLGGKPSYLFWKEELDGIYGRAFLPDENVLENTAELIESLELDTTVDDTVNSLRKVVGNLGAIDRAVLRLQQLVTEC